MKKNEGSAANEGIAVSRFAGRNESIGKADTSIPSFLRSFISSFLYSSAGALIVT